MTGFRKKLSPPMKPAQDQKRIIHTHTHTHTCTGSVMTLYGSIDVFVCDVTLNVGDKV